MPTANKQASSYPNYSDTDRQDFCRHASKPTSFDNENHTALDSPLMTLILDNCIEDLM